MTDGGGKTRRAQEGLQRRVRRAIQIAVSEMDLPISPAEVDKIAGRVFMGMVRPVLATVFAEGFAAGAECCGCCGRGRTNPHE